MDNRRQFIGKILGAGVAGLASESKLQAQEKPSLEKMLELRKELDQGIFILEKKINPTRLRLEEDSKSFDVTKMELVFSEIETLKIPDPLSENITEARKQLQDFNIKIGELQTKLTGFQNEIDKIISGSLGEWTELLVQIINFQNKFNTIKKFSISGENKDSEDLKVWIKDFEVKFDKVKDLFGLGKNISVDFGARVEKNIEKVLKGNTQIEKISLDIIKKLEELIMKRRN